METDVHTYVRTDIIWKASWRPAFLGSSKKYTIKLKINSLRTFYHCYQTQRFKYFFGRQWLIELIMNNSVCRTALATPSLLITRPGLAGAVLQTESQLTNWRLLLLQKTRLTVIISGAKATQKIFNKMYPWIWTLIYRATKLCVVSDKKTRRGRPRW